MSTVTPAPTARAARLAMFALLALNTLLFTATVVIVLIGGPASDAPYGPQPAPAPAPAPALPR